jgi:hypothetical protein
MLSNKLANFDAPFPDEWVLKNPIYVGYSLFLPTFLCQSPSPFGAAYPLKSS